MRPVSLCLVALLGVLLGACADVQPSLTSPDISAEDSTSGPSADADEAVIRAWVEAANQGDREALMAVTADQVQSEYFAPRSAEELADAVLDSERCPTVVGDIERVGDSFILDITTTDDGSCFTGFSDPGTSGQIVFEVHDGKVSRVP
jgi:hypothetical protein